MRAAVLLPLLPPMALSGCVEVEPSTEAELASWREGEVFPPPYAVPGQWTFDEPLCGVDPTGGGIPQQLGILAPTPPQGYGTRTCDPQDLNCVLVTDTAGLEDAAESNPGNDLEIILADGYYLGSELQGDSFLRLGRGHRLWAQNAGGAILTFGVYAGGNPCAPALAERFDGPEFHGLVFDIDDSQYAFRPSQAAGQPTSALANYGHSRGMKVQDCWFRGWGEVERAISVSRPDGLVVERVEISSFARFGVMVDLAWPEPSVVCPADPAPVVVGDPARLADLSVHGIADPVWSSQGAHVDCGNPLSPPPPGSYCPGTQEHGIWIGETTILDRARLRDVAWSGVVVGDNQNTLNRVALRDLDVDDVGSNEDGWGGAVGFERGNDGTVLDRFCVGPNVRRGVHSEWDQNDPSTANVNLEISNGWSRAQYVGVSLDKGTRHASIADVRIENACLASMYIKRNNNIHPDIDDPFCCSTSTWSSIDLSGASSTCEILTNGFPTLGNALPPNDCATVIDGQNDCIPLNIADFTCGDVGGLDTCP